MTDTFVGRKVLGRYRIVQKIGHGGMGVIYLARQEGAADFAKPVVVKRAFENQPSLLALMGREARIMSHLHHPAIVDVLDFAEDEGAALLVLDYVHGYHLGQWSRFIRSSGRKFPVDFAIQIVCTMLDALHYAHTVPGPDGKPLGVVHRDVSPGNVLIDVSGAVKLADFGIARMHSDQTQTTSEERLLKGKLSYMAPELLSLGEPNVQTDVYAAAIVLNELLCGTNEMHVSGSIEATAARVLYHKPQPVSELRDDVPKGLDEALAWGFAKTPAERCPDAAQLASKLRALRTGSEEDVVRALTKAIGEDFRNPQMATLVGGHDLVALDRAWREAPRNDAPKVDPKAANAIGAMASPSVPPVPVVSMPPTAIMEKPGATGAVPSASTVTPRRTGLIAGGVALVAAIAGGAVAITRMTAAPAPVAPSIYVVGGEIAGADGLAFEAGTNAQGMSSAVAPSTATAAIASTPTTEPVRSAANTAASAPIGSHPASGVEGLTRAFARREPQVAACFDANAADLRGSPELAIRFNVDTQGHVTSAQVLPAQVSSTPLGACLVGVARGTQFAPQPQAVSFRIPLVARRGQ